MTPKGRKRLIIIAAIITLYSLFCCKKTRITTNKNTTTTDPQNANTGGIVVGGNTGSGYVEIFEYYGNNTGEDIDFTSHSIVSKPVANIGVDLGVANSFCEYWVYDSNNNLIVYCKNTRSGLHPNYANAFNYNNHLPQYSKKLPVGTYRLVYKNISTDSVNQTLLFGLIANNANDIINTVVTSGATYEGYFTIYLSENSSFKMNNNVYN